MSKEGILTKENSASILGAEMARRFCLKEGENLPPAIEMALKAGASKDSTPEQQEFLNSLSMAVYSTVMNPKTDLYEANAHMLGAFENQDAARELANSVLPKKYSKEEWAKKDFVSSSIDKGEQQSSVELSKVIAKATQKTL